MAHASGRKGRFRRLERKPKACRDCRVSHVAAMHVEPAAQARVAGNRAETAGGKSKAIRKRRIVQRMTRCKRHRAGHIRDAIMDHPAFDESRGGMRRRMRAFETAALINCDIDKNSALSDRKSVV